MSNHNKEFHLPDKYQGDTLTARLNIAKDFDTLARQSELIDLEARCKTADMLEAIHNDLANITATLKQPQELNPNGAPPRSTALNQGGPSSRPVVAPPGA